MGSLNLFQDRVSAWVLRVSFGSGGLTTRDNRRLVDDISWYSLWLRTVGSLGLTR